MHSSEHGPWVVVYKIDYFVLGTLSSSLVLLNTRVALSLKPLSFKSQQQWHEKKFQELWEIKANSIYSAIDRGK